MVPRCLDLNGKVAVVTGAARGLGFAVCQALSKRGAKVVLSARTEAEAKTAAADVAGTVLAVGCDVRAPMELAFVLQRAVTEYGQVDLWVNAAGPAGTFGPARALTWSANHEEINATVQGTHAGTMLALKHMAERGSGTIVNVVGRVEEGPRPKNAAWDASKAWVQSFTLALAEEQAGTSIGLIAFAPGLMESRSNLMPVVAAGMEPEFKARLGLMRTKAVPPHVPAARLAQAIEREERGLVSGVPPLWAIRGPLRMVFGGRPDFVISPKVLPKE